MVATKAGDGMGNGDQIIHQRHLPPAKPFHKHLPVNNPAQIGQAGLTIQHRSGDPQNRQFRLKRKGGEKIRQHRLQIRIIMTLQPLLDQNNIPVRAGFA